MLRTRLADLLSLVLMALLFVAAFAPTASAQKRADDKRARAHFEQGRLAVGEARYEDALLHFERSYALSEKPVLLFNIANALDRLRRDEEAITKYEAYLAQLPNAENRPQVEGRLQVLRHDVETRQAALAASVPTAQEVAAAEVAPVQTAPVAPVSQPSQSETRPLYKKWWVWTAVGTAVVAAVVIGAVTASSGNKSEQQDALVVNSMTRKVEL